MITGSRCAVCGTEVDVATPLPWKCPHATPADPYHVLHLVDDGRSAVIDDANPIIRFAPRSAWWAFAHAHGLDDEACVDLADRVADGFNVTPFQRSDGLSNELGIDLWVKDETGNLAGSHKARHLIGILLHLAAAEQLGLVGERRPLAIASCGNAAIAAATLAQRVGWPLDVYVPDWMSAAVGEVLSSLGARIHRCERRAGDPPGDPAMHRFREAVAAGSIPFSVQGPENALSLDTGRTLGFELAEQIAAVDPQRSDWRLVVQVGGGALAACAGAGVGPEVRLDTVQTEGCAPLADTWARIAEIDHPERYWPQVMRPWSTPYSQADGILDDETYDWIADVAVMVESGGGPIVAAEADVVRAHELATAAGYDVSATGSAGLAGVLTIIGELRRSDRLVVVMSGVAR